jgi:hypothetical protein
MPREKIKLGKKAAAFYFYRRMAPHFPGGHLAIHFIYLERLI